jgi:2-keto-3-deoxy-L-fuconate dehydrogenase
MTLDPHRHLDVEGRGRLAGRVAVVTGGASGIGRAIALRFGSEEARIGILDIDSEGAERTAQEVLASGGSAVAVCCDVTDQRDVDSAFVAVADRLGPLDLLVNSAGIAHIGTVETTEVADFDRLYAVNVRGVYNCLRAGVRAMKGRGGSIVNLASVASCVGMPDRFAYSMTKGAVLTMTYSVSCDFVKDGIRCNAIAPGRVHTPFVDGFLARNYPGREAQEFESLSKVQPIGRMGEPDEVAALAVFLCSDEASFITGANFLIDGGFVNLRV